MSVDPVQSRPINTISARNESLSSQHYTKNIDNTQMDQARLDNAYQYAILGGVDIFDYSQDQQSLTDQLGKAMNLRSYNSIAAKEAWAMMQENQKARGSDSMLELAKA